MAKNHQLSAVVNAALAADNPIVAAPGAGKVIVVYGFYLVATGANTVTWKSGTTAKSGPMDMPALGVFPVPNGAERELFRCAPDEALNLALTAATKVAGGVSYEVVPFTAVV